MAPSPAKRRKLSPETPAPQTAPTTPSRRSVPRAVPDIALTRPSFASPTKASIARHHPQLLAKHASSGADDGKNNSVPVVGDTSATVKSSNEKEPVVDASEAGTQKSAIGDGQKIPEPDAEPPAVAQPTPTSQPAEVTAPVASVPPRRGLRTPSKIKLTPPRAVNTQSQPANIPKQPPIASQPTDPMPTNQPKEAEEEPELPPTPVQRGLKDPVVTTPPSGIHDTPSKRGRKGNKSRAEPSRLKPPLEPSQRSEAGAEADPKTDIPVELPNTSEYPSRGIVPPDPYAAKKKIRDELLEQVKRLQADVALGKRETMRQHQYHVSKKGPAELKNTGEIVGLLSRSIAAYAPKVQKPKATSIVHLIGSFLPFARRVRTPEVILPKVDPLPSHSPLPLEDPLPHLQIFTPLTYTSTITLPPTPPSTTDASSSSLAPAPAIQHHSITITAPSSLFSARVNMAVNTASFSIASLSIPSLDPAADPELGPWIRQRARNNSILGRDVNAICWAMSRWYELAIRRARFWCELERELGSEEGRRRAVERIQMVRGKRKRGAGGNEDAEGEGRSGGGEDRGEADGGGGDLNPNEKEKAKKWTRKQLLPQMGRTVFILRGGTGVELRIQWDIVFDWTGDAESCISATARVPSICKF